MYTHVQLAVQFDMKLAVSFMIAPETEYSDIILTLYLQDIYAEIYTIL